MATDTAPVADPEDLDGSTRGVTDLNRVRRLLLGLEGDELAALNARISDPALRTEAVAEVLAEAVAMRTRRDDRLGDALGSTIETALHKSIERDPQPIANAIYPVIGPSVRKAITAALEGMVQSLNQMLEQSLSAKSLRWRFEAWRAGKPFAEYVLLRTLVFRVEQLFLIHAETGLVLKHLSVDPATERDPGMVSGMLTAIQDFLRDSFAANDEDGLTQMRLSQGDVLIEAGPYAVLAAVVRGEPPTQLRPALEDALEHVHLSLGGELRNFSGDDAPFEPAADILRPCLMERTRDQDNGPDSGGKRRPWPALLALTLLLGLGGWYAYTQYVDGARMNALLAALQAEPGYVITASQVANPGLVVRALRDPDARPIETLLEENRVDATRVRWSESAWQAQDPELVLTRARRQLAPPPGASVDLANGVLEVRGSAPADWYTRALMLGPVVAGIWGFDASNLNRQPTVTERRAVITSEIESTDVQFGVRSAAIEPPYSANLSRAAERFAQLRRLAAPGQPPRLRIIGSTDATGSRTLNARLSVERAAAVRTFLLERDVPAELIDTVARAPGTSADAGRRAQLEVVPGAYPQPEITP